MYFFLRNTWWQLTDDNLVPYILSDCHICKQAFNAVGALLISKFRDQSRLNLLGFPVDLSSHAARKLRNLECVGFSLLAGLNFCHDMPGQKRNRGGKHSGAERAPKKVKKVYCRSTLLLSERLSPTPDFRLMTSLHSRQRIFQLMYGCDCRPNQSRCLCLRMNLTQRLTLPT